MKSSIRRRIRIVLYSTVIISLALAAAIREHRVANYYRYEAIAYARQAASELSISADEISTTLIKCSLSPSPELTRALCSKLYGICMVTSSALDALPWQHELENLTSMLEDAETLALKGVQSGEVDREEIHVLKSEFENLSQILEDAYSGAESGVISFGGSVIDPYNDDKDGSERTLSDLNDSASAHSPKVLSPSPADYSIEEAKAKSGRLLSCSPEEIECREVSGNYGTVYYCAANDTTVGLDGKGHIVYFRNDTLDGGEGISSEEAAGNAVSFSRDISGLDGEIVSYEINEGYYNCLISGAENEIHDIDTPIRVSVDMANGKIACYDAVEYCAAADERQSIASSFRPEEDTDIDLPDEADAESRRICFIEMPWQEERLCYEYTAASEDGLKYKIYYDVSTHMPVDLRIMTQSENRLDIK